MGIRLTLCLLILLTTPVLAVPIVVDDPFATFAWSGQFTPPGPSTSGQANTADPNFTFTLVTNGELRVTDFQASGDQFQVFVNTVPPAGPTFTTDGFNLGFSQGNPAIAFTDPNFSSGSLALTPGAYSVQIYQIQSNFASGLVGIQVVSTPELSAASARSAAFILWMALLLASRRQRFSLR